MPQQGRPSRRAPVPFGPRWRALPAVGLAISLTIALLSSGLQAARAGIQPLPSPSSGPSSCPGAQPGTIVQKLVPPPPSVQLDKLESDDCIFAFDERQDVQVPSGGVAVDISKAGVYNTGKLSSSTIPKGTWVRSQFIHADRPGKPTTDKVFDGTVTFDSSILGVMVLDATLYKSEGTNPTTGKTSASSDPHLKSPTTLYPTTATQRGLEFSKDGSNDGVTWGPDNHTLHVHLHLLNIFDQIRVITAGSPSPSPSPSTAVTSPPPQPTPTPTPTPAPGDVRVFASTTRTRVAIGQPYGYSVSVYSVGTSPAQNASVAIDVPANYSVSASSSTVGSCAVTATGLTCSFGTLAPGSSARVDITGTGTAAARATLRAVATSSQTDPTPGDDSAKASALVVDPGNIWSWGRNSAGQLGDGTTTWRTLPGPVGGLSGAVQLSAGNGTSVALTKDGGAWTWGDRIAGQMGDGTTSGLQLTPQQVPGLDQVVQVADGGTFMLALRSDGDIEQWGRLITDDPTTEHDVPALVPAAHGITAVAATAPGNEVSQFALALDGDGRVWAWGTNDRGQLGDGTLTTQSTPVPVANLDGVAAIATGMDADGYALRTDGSIWGWGAGLGTMSCPGGSACQPVPRLLFSMPDAVAIAGPGSCPAGVIQECVLALGSDGRVWRWGGGGAFSQQLDQVTGLPAIVDLASGGQHDLARDSAENVYAWGSNLSGELGDGTTNTSTVPVTTRCLSQAQTIAAGGAFSLAIAAPDIDPPVGSFTINEGASTTAESTVTLDQTASDARSCVAKLRVSNAGDLSNGVLVNGATLQSDELISWSLTDTTYGGVAGDGPHTVYVQWQDTAGNWSALSSQTISLNTPSSPPPFVNASGTSLVRAGQPIRLAGASIYGASNPGGTASLDQDLSWAASAQLNTIRLVDVFDERGLDDQAPYDATNWARVDAMLDAIRTHGMVAVLDLSSFRNHLVNRDIRLHGWQTACLPGGDRSVVDYAAIDPYRLGLASEWQKFINFVAYRTNSVNGIPYRDDPTIAVVSIAGEPQPPASQECGKPTDTADLTDFYQRTLGMWRAADPNHLRSSGGLTQTDWEQLYGTSSGIDGKAIFALPDNTLPALHTYPPQYAADGTPIDYQTPVLGPYATSLNKPWFTEEFGWSQSVGDAVRASRYDWLYKEQQTYASAGALFWNLGPEVSTASDDANPGTPATWNVIVAKGGG